MSLERYHFHTSLSWTVNPAQGLNGFVKASWSSMPERTETERKGKIKKRKRLALSGHEPFFDGGFLIAESFSHLFEL
jgi:hypothetical protein